MKSDTQIMMSRYKDRIFAIAFNICKNAADADDIVQDTFLQYHMSNKKFENEEHIRNWLFRVAVNKAKNLTASFWKRNRVSLEDYMQTLPFESDDDENMFAQVMSLPQKYRLTLHLFYYEGYSVKEIADLLKLSESNVKVRLNRGRNLLKTKLTEEFEDDNERKI